MMFSMDARASPNSIIVFSMWKSSFSTPANPDANDRFSTIVERAWSTFRIGIPYMGLVRSVLAAGFVTSFAPMTTATSDRLNSEFISSKSFSSSYGTSASASNTFMCPGILPATGCIAYLIDAPLSFSISASSRTWCCACATANPYPGTNITDWAYPRTIAASGASIERTGLSAVVAPVPGAPDESATPNPPNMTFANDLFMARVMILVSMSPDAPTSEPAMISMLFSSANPAAAAAIPEYEFSNAITTGMSAPPIGMTIMIPMTSAIIAIAIRGICELGSMVSHTAIAIVAIEMMVFRMCLPGINTGCVATMPCNFPKAIRLPVRVMDPMMMDAATVIGTIRFTSELLSLIISAAATIADAAPPNPLNTATICGIAVSCTFRAATMPISAPMITPTMIHSYLTMSWLMSVTTTAINIPSADSLFPARAVSGDLSQRSPVMKSADASMYAAVVRLAMSCSANIVLSGLSVRFGGTFGAYGLLRDILRRR